MLSFLYAAKSGQEQRDPSPTAEQIGHYSHDFGPRKELESATIWSKGVGLHPIFGPTISGQDYQSSAGGGNMVPEWSVVRGRSLQSSGADKQNSLGAN
jgi:hypothetical protein